jgi:hypothetical protein
MRVLFLFIFIALPIAALIWFFRSAFALLASISSDVVLVERGVFYMFGSGIAMLALGYAGVQESWFRIPLTGKQRSILTKTAIAGVFLTFAVPALAGFGLNALLVKKGYARCEQAEYQYSWRMYREAVYIQPSVKCDKALEERLYPQR